MPISKIFCKKDKPPKKPKKPSYLVINEVRIYLDCWVVWMFGAERYETWELFPDCTRSALTVEMTGVNPEYFGTGVFTVTLDRLNYDRETGNCAPVFQIDPCPHPLVEFNIDWERP